MSALTNLWRRLRRPAAAPAAVPATVEPKRIPWDEIARRVAELKPEGTEPRRKIEPPQVLPGVRPKEAPTGDKLVLAMDGEHAEPTQMTYDEAGFGAAWGFAAGDRAGLGPGLAFLGFPFLAELVQISEYRIPSETLSTEMVRRWLKLKSKGGTDKSDAIKKLDERLEQLRVRDLFREAALKTEQFGRAHIMINVKGQDDDRSRQLPLTQIKKGELVSFACIEPYWLTPYSWNATHPERADFYRPQSWYVLGRKTHHTRLLTFIFREVPDLLKPAYDFAGISMTQLMMPYIQRWLRTAKSVNDLINIFSIVTLATDLQSLLQNPADFVKRLQAFTQTRDNRGLMAINKDSEELAINDASLASLDKLQAQAQEHMATPARMPLLKFFGITPSGLNATAEPEMLAWYDYVHALQELGMSQHFERVLAFVQMDVTGTVDPDIIFEWQALYEPNDKEKSEMRKVDADRDTALINAGVVSPDEVRERLKDEPESGYNNLKGDAPDPPSVIEHQLGEESADNAAERDEAAARSDHRRSQSDATTAQRRSEKDAAAAHKRTKELERAKAPASE